MSNLSKSDKRHDDLTQHHTADHQKITRELVHAKEPVGTHVPDLEGWIRNEKGNNPKLGVLSIFMFGGVGKTTIAMALYRMLGPEFDSRAMVTVPQNSDPQIVWANILAQLKQQFDSGSKEGKDSARAPPWRKRFLSG